MAKKSKAIATTVPASLMKSIQKDVGKGMEQADKDSFAIPFIITLQSQSPQLDDVAGAKAGQLINSVTNELFTTLNVVPVYFERVFLRWVDRDAGGGFRGSMTPLEVEEALAAGTVQRGEGLDIRYSSDERLSDTRQHYLLVQQGDKAWTPAIIGCASTQIKKSKQWMTQINNFKIGDVHPPSWVRMYTIETVKESNAKGSWYGIKITPGDFVDENLYKMALNFYDQIRAGKVKVQHEDLES